MWRLFGKAKEAPAAPAAPKVTLTEHVGKLGEREADYEKKIAECDRQLQAIKAQSPRGDVRLAPAAVRSRAVNIIKRKKMFEQGRDQAMSRGMNIERLVQATDSARDARAHVEMMRDGAKELKGAVGEIGDVDDIAELADDMGDAMADLEDVNQILNQDFAGYDGVSEADLDAELAGLSDAVPEMEAPAAAAPAAAGGAYHDDAAIASYLAPAAASAGGAGGGGGGGAFPSIPMGIPMGMPPARAPVVAASTRF